MKTALFVSGLIVSMAVVGVCQVRNVTNSTLEKFQQRRLAAERDYRANYGRMGFPSPEELDRRRDVDMVARIKLAEQLRHARLEKQRLELESRTLELQAASKDSDQVGNTYNQYNGFYGGYIGGYGGSYFDGRFWHHRRHYYNGGFSPFGIPLGGYRATPVGVYPDLTPRQIPFVRQGWD